MRADVALQRELARDDFFDGDFLVPAVAAILFLAARLGDFLGAAQRAPRLRRPTCVAWRHFPFVSRKLYLVNRMERPTHAGLRHLALNARDLGAMKRFYIECWDSRSNGSPIRTTSICRLASTTSRCIGRRVRQVPRVLRVLQVRRVPGAGARSSRRDRQERGRCGSVGGVSRKPRRDDRCEAARRTATARESCYFSDPDGNRVQIIHHPPISKK